jgi:hypothetical protein
MSEDTPTPEKESEGFSLSQDEYIMLQQMRQGSLGKEQAVLMKKVKDLDAYQKMKTDMAEKEATVLQKMKFITKLPYPKQLITMYALIGTLLFSLFFGVNVFYMLIAQFKMDIPAVTNGLYLCVFVIFLGFIVGMLVFRNAKDFIIPAMKAGLKNKPMVALFDKNMRLQLVVPKEVNENMWTLTDTLSIIPDPEAVNIGPNRVPIVCGIPEYPVAFNPRKVVLGQAIPGIDMTSIRQYAEMYDTRARISMRSGMDAIKPMLPYIMMMVVCAIIVLPIGYGILQQYNTSSRWQDQAFKYKDQLRQHNIVPYDEAPLTAQQQAEAVKNAQTGTTQPPAQPGASMASILMPASSGAGIK